MSQLSVGILVVSDTAARDVTADRSGPVLRDIFTNENGQWVVERIDVVPDEQDEIAAAVLRMTDDNLHLVVTSGGTGFTERDCTPEAIAPLIDKHAPGIVHGMLNASLQVTPFAMMARPICGVRRNTLILTLPGSPKGAKENLQAVIKVLPHACEQIAGGESRKMHAGGTDALEKKASITKSDKSTVSQSSHRDHHHHHDHSHAHSHPRPIRHTKDISGPVTARHRESPYPMISVNVANSMILACTSILDVVNAVVDSSLVGAVLAEDVLPSEEVPAYRASIVDGYAVRVKDCPGLRTVAFASHAASSSEQELGQGEIARITTGAPLPRGAEAVVMVEDTKLIAKTEDGKEEKDVEILASGVEPGENIREIGSDVKKGSRILSKGDQITAVGGEIGLLASVGVASVQVYRRPKVGVLSTGDELIAHTVQTNLREGQIRDSNRPTLLSTLEAWGFPTLDLGIAKDVAGSLDVALKKGLEQSDVVITTGGVSMGELDLLKPTIEQSLGGTIHFGRVAMKPGKPTTFATVPFDGKTKLIFALPGNPASASVTFHLFVLPSLRKAAGMEPAALPVVRCMLSHDVSLDPRPEYHRVRAQFSEKGTLQAASTGGQRSSRVGSLKTANALLCLPPRTKEETIIAKGSHVDAIIIGKI